MVLPVYLYGHPVLRKTAAEVPAVLILNGYLDSRHHP